MKTKKLSKKLELNKTTISSLNAGQLTTVKGGDIVRSINGTNCALCPTYNCPPYSAELTACLTNFCCIATIDTDID